MSETRETGYKKTPMSKKNEKHDMANETADYFRAVPLPFTISECVGLSLDELLMLYVKHHVVKPEKKKTRDVTIEMRLSEATLVCRIQNDICTEAYLQTDDIEDTSN